MNYVGKVLGIRYLNFQVKDGKPVKGHQVWVQADTSANGWRAGVEVLKVWVPDDTQQSNLVAGLQLESLVSISFNRYGKPVLVEVCNG